MAAGLRFGAEEENMSKNPVRQKMESRELIRYRGDLTAEGVVAAWTTRQEGANPRFKKTIKDKLCETGTGPGGLNYMGTVSVVKKSCRRSTAKTVDNQERTG